MSGSVAAQGTGDGKERIAGLRDGGAFPLGLRQRFGVSATVGRVQRRDHFTFVRQHLAMGRDGRAAGGAGGAGCVLQKLAMFGIAEIETLMPVVRPGQIRPGHYSLGFASLKGSPAAPSASTMAATAS